MKTYNMTPIVTKWVTDYLRNMLAVLSYLNDRRRWSCRLLRHRLHGRKDLGHRGRGQLHILGLNILGCRNTQKHWPSPYRSHHWNIAGCDTHQYYPGTKKHDTGVRRLLKSEISDAIKRERVRQKPNVWRWVTIVSWMKWYILGNSVVHCTHFIYHQRILNFLFKNFQ